MRKACVDGETPRARCGGAMRLARLLQLLVLLYLDLARSQVADDLNLSQMGNEYKACIRDGDHRVGICVHFTLCHKNQSLAFGGNIFKYDVRSCGRDNWCCTDDTSLPVTATPDTSGNGKPLPATGNCLRASNDCPWCVAIYRPGGDVDRGQRTKSGLYCGGALVGARVVLTSAACIVTVGEENIWVRVPASAAPARDYPVTDRLRHESYNSGNSKNDFGLLVLKDSVEFATSPFSACVSFAPPPAAGCLAAGFSLHEKVVLTSVSLRDGDCPPRKRSIPDLVCATPAGAGSCDISPGAPVLCPAPDSQGGLAIAGVVRRRCWEGAAQLGKLQPHADWLQVQLRRLGVSAWQYAL